MNSDDLITAEENMTPARREALRLMSVLPEFTPGDTRRVVSVCDVEEMVRAGMELNHESKREN